MPCDSSSERWTCPTPRLRPGFSIGSTPQAGGGSTSPTSTETARPRRPSAAGFAHDDSPDGVIVYAKGCHPPYARPEFVSAELDKALGLLGVDRIDVFVLHRDEPSLPVAAFADALLEQVAAEKIGGFGVSNWTVPRLRELQQHLERIGEDGLVVFSNHFSLAEMVAEPWPGCLAVDKQDLLALADTDVLILAWSSLATGFFAGRDPASWDSSGQPGAARAGDRARRRARDLGRGNRARVRLPPARPRAAGRRDALRGPPRRSALRGRDRVEPRAARVAGERRAALRFLLLEKGGSQWLRSAPAASAHSPSWQARLRSPVPPPLRSMR